VLTSLFYWKERMFGKSWQAINMSKKSPINAEVIVRKNEPIERALKRFIKKVKKEKILEDYREHMYYEKPSDKRKRMAKRRKATLEKLKQKKETN